MASSSPGSHGRGRSLLQRMKEKRERMEAAEREEQRRIEQEAAEKMLTDAQLAKIAPKPKGRGQILKGLRRKQEQ